MVIFLSLLVHNSVGILCIMFSLKRVISIAQIVHGMAFSKRFFLWHLSRGMDGFIFITRVCSFFLHLAFSVVCEMSVQGERYPTLFVHYYLFPFWHFAFFAVVAFIDFFFLACSRLQGSI
jgi:hypothetical protein